ncbi:hypothetical protein Tco_0951244 [Tanacetum coccineum]|uniref:Retrotransposon gag domain-containing protein n=1 Tax=Tanacetum coccineum TaxID=301880 RepID=A0ABQ5DUH4_9ASTR
MSTHEQITNNPTSAVRNTGGRNGPQGLEEPMSDEVLREMCDKNYHQLLPLIAEKMQKEKEQKDKLNAVKARLIYGEESGVKIRSHEESRYSESKTPTARTEPRRRRGDRRGVFNSWEERSQLPPARPIGVNKRENRLVRPANIAERKIERNPFTPRIRHFSLPRTRMPSHVKTYDESGDPEDHLKLFQSAAKTEGWAMPIWCHMFNSTLTGNARVWFDKLPKESIDSYEDLRTALGKLSSQQSTSRIPIKKRDTSQQQKKTENLRNFMERYTGRSPGH